MPRAQFSLKTLLRLMAVVAAFCAAWNAFRPPLFEEGLFGTKSGDEYHDRYYGWTNGTVLIVSQKRGDWLPRVAVTTGVDVSFFDN